MLPEAPAVATLPEQAALVPTAVTEPKASSRRSVRSLLLFDASGTLGSVRQGVRGFSDSLAAKEERAEYERSVLSPTVP